MKRVQRLKPVQDLAARREREAAASLGEQITRVAEVQRRLDELLIWEQDYIQRMGSAVSAGELQSYRLFMARLGEAIDQQRALMVDVRRSEARARDHWQARYARYAALSKLIERYRREERDESERREQRQLDEFNVSRAYVKR